MQVDLVGRVRHDSAESAAFGNQFGDDFQAIAHHQPGAAGALRGKPEKAEQVFLCGVGFHLVRISARPTRVEIEFGRHPK